MLKFEYNETPMDKYLETGIGAENIVPEEEDVVVIESLKHIDLILALGPDIYNRLDIGLCMSIHEVPDDYLKIINGFNRLERTVSVYGLKEAIRWHTYIDNVFIEEFVDDNKPIGEYDRDIIMALYQDYGGFHDFMELLKKYTPDVYHELEGQ